jgi:hypothetical protein
LKNLVESTLRVMETEYVEKVSERMNSMFMEIVGSDPATPFS